MILGIGDGNSVGVGVRLKTNILYTLKASVVVAPIILIIFKIIIRAFVDTIIDLVNTEKS